MCRHLAHPPPPCAVLGLITRGTSPLHGPQAPGPARSGAVVAAVRSATAARPVVSTGCAPVTDQRWVSSHDGVVRGWPGSPRSCP